MARRFRCIHGRWAGILMAAIGCVAANVPAPARAQGAAATTETSRIEAARIEGAIAGGLRWLAERQLRDGPDAGAWPCDHARYRPAIAALAGLAFLANGHLPGEGPYGDTVAQTLRYVMTTMDPDGYLGQGDRSGMYLHAIITLFGLSCLGMQADAAIEPDLAEWCRRSLDVIVAAHQVAKPAVARGGWRYTPYTTESDVSVTAWQLLVLHAARQAGFVIEPATIEDAMAYLNRAFVPLPADDPEPEPGNGGDTRPTDAPAGGFVYRPGVSTAPEPAATALVVFIKSLFETEPDRRTREALEYLRRYQPSWGGPQYGGYFYFAGFYMVQGMFQIGGDTWDAFGTDMRRILLDHQAGDGSWPFPPDNTAQSRLTGPAYPVAMAVLMLSLDKQFLPMYQRQRRLFR